MMFFWMRRRTSSIMAVPGLMMWTASTALGGFREFVPDGSSVATLIPEVKLAPVPLPSRPA